MKRLIQEFLYFSKGERRGTMVLLLLCLLLFVPPMLFPLFQKKDELDFTEFKADIVAFEQSTFVEEEPASSIKQEYSLFAFNPNTADKAAFIKLGISEKVASTILKYRDKGGRFYKKEDFKKIYTLDEKTYARLEAYISIPKKKKKPYPFESKKKEFSDRAAQTPSYSSKDSAQRVKRPSEFKKVDFASLEIDINQAAPEEWQLLYGIGPVLAARIVNFREKLGGFIDVNQIATTYGLADSTFQKMKPHLLVSPILHRMEINKIDAKRLLKHPYLNYKKANVIINYRNNHGPFDSLGDLKKIRALKEEEIQRLAPYLDFSKD